MEIDSIKSKVIKIDRIESKDIKSLPKEKWGDIQGWCEDIQAGSTAEAGDLKSLWKYIGEKHAPTGGSVSFIKVRRLYSEGGQLQTGALTIVQDTTNTMIDDSLTLWGAGPSVHIDRGTYKSDGTGDVIYSCVIPAVGKVTDEVHPTLLVDTAESTPTFTFDESSHRIKLNDMHDPDYKKATPGKWYCVSALAHAQPEIEEPVNRLFLQVGFTGSELLTAKKDGHLIVSNLRF